MDISNKDFCHQLITSDQSKIDKEIKVSIIGSCVSRDVFGLTKDMHTVNGHDIYNIERFVQSIHPVSATAAPVENEFAKKIIHESSLTKASSFYKRNFKFDITKDWYQFLSEVSSDWLVIDFSTVRDPVLKLLNSYISYSLFLAIKNTTEALEQNSALSFVSQLDQIPTSSLDPVLYKEALKRYLDMLLSLYPAERIIVLDVQYAFTFVNDSSQRLLSPNFYSNHINSEKNQEICIAYQFAKEYMPNAHFIDSLPALVAKENHIWGKHGLHYVNDIYSYFFECVNNIICENSSSSLTTHNIQSNILATQIKYLEKVFKNYSTIAMHSIQNERNLLQPAEGIEPGEYLQNCIKLTVFPDYSYSLQGTAGEDTVFYLYSYYKNPLKGWRNVKQTTESGQYLFSTNLSSSPNDLQVQLILSNGPEDIRWINGHMTTRFSLSKPYTHRLIRIIIKKGISVNTSGYMILEKE